MTNRSLLNCLIAPAIIAAAGCAATGPTLSSSVDRLEDGAFAMERQADQRSVRQSARELSEEAREFRRTLIHYRADRLDLQAAFEDVSRSYHELRDEVKHSRDHATERYFEPVTTAYLDVEREMDKGNRYARGL